MPLSFFNETVTVLRAPLRSTRGTAVRDWVNAVAHEVSRCQVTAAATSQDRDGRVVRRCEGRNRFGQILWEHLKLAVEYDGRRFAFRDVFLQLPRRISVFEPRKH